VAHNPSDALADGDTAEDLLRRWQTRWQRDGVGYWMTAVIGWVTRIRPDQRLIARIRPDNTPSARVAAKTGLVRAADLDTDGEDGPDHIWVLPPDQGH
jgi:hypothetical protein